MVAPDVGGGFGAKFVMYPEEVVVAAAGAHAAPADQMDRGPARAFPRRRPGARPVLGPRGRVRRRRPAARRARHADPRRGRLHAAGHQPAIQRLDRAAGPLHPAGLRARRAGGRDQQGRHHAGARRRLSRRRVRHGARARRASRSELDLDRAEVRRRNLVPAGEDALRHAAEDPRRLADHARQRRLSRAASSCALEAIDYAGFPERQAERARRGPLPRHRHRQRRQGHRPRPVRIRHRAHRPLRPHLGLHRRDADGAGHPHRAGADLRRAVRRVAGHRHGDGRRHRRHSATARAASPAGRRSPPARRCISPPSRCARRR